MPQCHSSHCRAVCIDILVLHKEGKNLYKAEIFCTYLYRCNIVRAHVHALGPELVRKRTRTSSKESDKINISTFLGIINYNAVET